MKYLYIKSNRKQYAGFWGKNGFMSFEYGYLDGDKREPLNKEADAIIFEAPIQADYIDKDTMRIWGIYGKKEVEWKLPATDTAWLCEKK